MNTDKEKLSYTMGQQIGSGITQDKIDVDTSALTLGLTHYLEGQPSQLTGEEMQEVLQNFQKTMQEKANGALEENAKMNSITKKVWNQNYLKESEKSANDSQSV